jgi:hypothetical protein
MAREGHGDGLPGNRSIRKPHFSESTLILDFVHVLSDLFGAARAVHADARDAWDLYRAWMRGCWSGDVAQVIAELPHGQAKLGLAAKDTPETDPRAIVSRTITDLGNNRPRMDYRRIAATACR